MARTAPASPRKTVPKKSAGAAPKRKRAPSPRAAAELAGAVPPEAPSAAASLSSDSHPVSSALPGPAALAGPGAARLEIGQRVKVRGGPFGSVVGRVAELVGSEQVRVKVHGRLEVTEPVDNCTPV